MSEIPYGYCKCGCGKTTGTYTHNQKGKKGQHHPYYTGHNFKNSLDIFWSQIDKSGGCWIWTGKVNNKGYGRFCIDGFAYTHRLSYAIHNNVGPEDIRGLGVLHKCDTPRCVNPAHLFLGTQQDNIKDCKVKGRTCRGEKQGRSKLSAADVLSIRDQFSRKMQTAIELGKLYGVHTNHITAIISRRFWNHL